jgi:hypothetical protein
MPDRRRAERVRPAPDKRLLTLHGARGHVCGRAEDESEGGVGVRVRSADGLNVGQMVLVHRMHEQRLWMGTIRYMNPQGDGGVRVGVELLREPASPIDLLDFDE